MYVSGINAFNFSLFIRLNVSNFDINLIKMLLKAHFRT